MYTVFYGVCIVASMMFGMFFSTLEASYQNYQDEELYDDQYDMYDSDIDEGFFPDGYDDYYDEEERYLDSKNKEKSKYKNRYYQNYQKNLNYLKAPCFEERHKQAIDWTQDCEFIIEIGGGAKPISQFIKDRPVIVIDPIIRSCNDGRIMHIGQKFENWEGIPLELQGKPYAVVILGLALDHMSESGWINLYGLINGAKTAIIEYSSTYRQAEAQFKKIKKNTNKIKVYTRQLDLSENNFRKYQMVRPLRKMICLQ